MIRSLSLLLLVTACDRVYGLAGQAEIDAAIDTVPDSDVPIEVCAGEGLVRLCTIVVESEVSLRDEIDTTDDTRCQAHRVIHGADAACVIAADRIDVSFLLRATGTRPLVLFATDTITASAQIDVSSDRTATSGAGARMDCAAPNGATAMNEGAGGAGGTYQYVGGSGGATSMVAGTAPSPVLALTSLGGGCAGGQGGGTGAKTPAGAGGGAIYLIAGSSIEVDRSGGIDASGAGGDGGAARHGGGGGGSGGLVGLDAPSIVVEANIIAKGGAGGGGGDLAMGMPGSEAVLASPTRAVSGGMGGGTGGSGGDGSNGTVGGGPGGAPMYGGGGGGGAAGYVLVYGKRVGAGILNPMPTM